ncbi:hypothetical protein [Herbaspirillum sp. alder98]|uniref:hypothetical protein n=1 Tax=Herbaspirillum sp. alder98 TaxID=2913096 RepID=UPI001CD912F8|nr:hypothetical protein [Herbaspirillum sp. alder98]MCA1322883.1 hypothetical protein [Herbaspirillum sp. alder98]
MSANNFSDPSFAYAMGVQRGRIERAESNAASWKSHARNLEEKLKIAEEAQMFREVAREATVVVLEAALAALSAKDPSSPLLDGNLREQMRRRHIADTLATKGYQFDISKGELIGKKR